MGINNCPAFTEGCPFKEMESVEELYNKLSEMPATHRLDQSTTAAKAVEQTLQMVHKKSVALKAQFNATCPVFATSCPFKTVTSYGVPLVQEMDNLLENWSLKAFDEVVKEASSQPISKALKAGTKLVHRSAENVHFVRDFLKGSVPKESYIELLRSLYHVYRAMEEGLECLPSHLKHCDFTVIYRAETIASDLRFYTGTPDIGQPSAGAQQYVDRMRLLAREDPLLLLAHAYTRYLGDLSGGQILARAAAKAYNLPEGTGAEFYRFEKIGSSPADLKAFKKVYRSSFDALQLSASRADALVQEANRAFLMNIVLFEERDVAAGYLARIRTLEEISELVESSTSALKFQEAYGASNVQSSGQCPFIPGAAGRRKPGEHSFHGDGGHSVCPWPFMWLHDPKTALVTHPLKNVAGLLTICGLLRVAWEYPRQSGAVLVASAVALPCLKPKTKKTKEEDNSQSASK